MALFNATVLDAWKRLEAQVEVSRRRLDHPDKGIVFRTRCERRAGTGVPNGIRTGAVAVGRAVLYPFTTRGLSTR